MMYPSVDKLTEMYGSRYTVAVAAAKRARQLVEGAPKLVDVKTTKPVSIALFELEAGKIKFEKPKAGIK